MLNQLSRGLGLFWGGMYSAIVVHQAIIGAPGVTEEDSTMALSESACRVHGGTVGRPAEAFSTLQSHNHQTTPNSLPYGGMVKDYKALGAGC